MKQKPIRIFAIVFFLLVNLLSFVEGTVGSWLAILLVPSFFVLVIIWLVQFTKQSKENGINEWRRNTLIVVSIALSMAICAMSGLTDFYDRIYGQNILVAGRDGPAYTLVLRIKSNKRYSELSSAFGIPCRYFGRYTLHNDTFFFDKQSHHADFKYEFAKVKIDSSWGNKPVLRLWQGYNDTFGDVMFISKNEMFKAVLR